jgi:hypothetical protein
VVRALALAFLLVAPAADHAAHAAPPVPPPYPKDLPAEVDGYRMDRIYPVYHMWLNRNREAALRAALRDTGGGLLHLWDSPFGSEIRSYDFGVLRIDTVSRYCTGRRYDRQPAGTCTDRYRYAVIPGSPYSNADVDAAIAKSFRTKELAVLMRAAGIAPSADYWNSRVETLFPVLTVPKDFWSPRVVVHSTDSEACPALKTAIAGLGQVSVTAAARDVKSWNFVPHGSHTWVRLSAATADDQPVNLEGSDSLYPLARPLWTAAEQCAPMTHDK